MIVVSRGRPRHLRLCLTGIGQLCHRDFEIVVVADGAGAQAVTEMGLADKVKLLRFDAANISAARNEGLAAAAGEIVAFIDDDAVPEPGWLCHLVRPFDDADVAATGGYVIGRDGISLQWTARAVNRLGETVALEAPGEEAFAPDPPAGFAVKTEGTNCAFRRAVLAGLGGFDPAFRFYLDETDVNLRLAAAGGRTVIVPRARVHHGFAASDRRAADRTPRDLTEIGASTMVFLRKHAPEAEHAPALAALETAERARLIRHMVAGGLEPRDVGRRLAGLTDGIAAGRVRPITPLAAIAPATRPFLPFAAPEPGAPLHLAGRFWQRRRLAARAAEAVAEGRVVAVFRFGPSLRRHRMRFHPGGWWEQTGGIFGPAQREEPAFRYATFRARVAWEWARVSPRLECR